MLMRDLKIIKGFFKREKVEYGRCTICNKKLKLENYSCNYPIVCDREECYENNYVSISEMFF